MNIFFALALAGAASLTPYAEAQPTQRLTVGAPVYFPNGKTTGTQRRFDLRDGATTWYVFTGKTLCEAQTVSTEKPSVAGNGWRLDLKSGAGGTLQATWERLWIAGKPATGGGTRLMKLGTGTPLVLDSIDGGMRIKRLEATERLRALKSADLVAQPVPDLEDGRSAALRDQMASLEKDLRELIDVQRLGLQNPRVKSVDSKMTIARQELQEYLTGRLSSYTEMLQRDSPLLPFDGCDALSMNLQITSESIVVSAPTETEVWLVHKDPAGVESTQRQVVRAAGGSGSSFVFDDIVVKTPAGPITVEVYGDLAVLTGHGDAGQPWLVLDVTRRYVNPGTSFAWKTKEGGAKFAQTLRPEEVVAFNLLPIKDDEGALLGHRFSVRVKTRILK